MTVTTSNVAAETRPYTPKGKKMNTPKAAWPTNPGATNPGMNGGTSAPANVTVPMGRPGMPGGMTEIKMPASGSKHSTHNHVKKAPGSRCG